MCDFQAELEEKADDSTESAPIFARFASKESIDCKLKNIWKKKAPVLNISRLSLSLFATQYSDCLYCSRYYKHFRDNLNHTWDVCRFYAKVMLLYIRGLNSQIWDPVRGLENNLSWISKDNHVTPRLSLSLTHSIMIQNTMKNC